MADLQNWVQETLASADGWPYRWGGGGPGVPWRPTGVDCSGFVTMALERLGLVLPGNTTRWGEDAVMARGRKIPTGQQRPGDVAVYDGHVEIVWTWPNEKGDSGIFGASGSRVHAKRSALTSLANKPPFIGFWRVDQRPSVPAPPPEPVPAPEPSPPARWDPPPTASPSLQEMILTWWTGMGSWSPNAEAARSGSWTLVSTGGDPRSYAPGNVPVGTYAVYLNGRIVTTLPPVSVSEGAQYDLRADGRTLTWMRR